MNRIVRRFLHPETLVSACLLVRPFADAGYIVESDAPELATGHIADDIEAARESWLSIQSYLLELGYAVWGTEVAIR